MVKKILKLIVIQLTFLNCAGQINLDFENWSNKFGTLSPDFWYNINFAVLLGDSVSCQQAVPSHTGNFAAKIRPITIKSFNNINLNGTLNTFWIPTIRNKSISFYYKYSATVKDSCFMDLSYYYGNMGSSSNVVGNCRIELDTVSTWKKVTLQINWTSNNFPDTAFLSFSTNNKDLTSSLIIDEISLNDTVQSIHGINSNTFSLKITGEGKIKTNCILPFEIIVFDEIGRVQTIVRFPESDCIEGLQKNRIYFYRIKAGNKWLIQDQYLFRLE
jgi:hypothetical protein